MLNVVLRSLTLKVNLREFKCQSGSLDLMMKKAKITNPTDESKQQNIYIVYAVLDFPNFFVLFADVQIVKDLESKS